jgi:hypothetical protein
VYFYHKNKTGEFRARGENQIGASISWRCGTNFLIACSVTASANYTPSILIYPRKHGYLSIKLINFIISAQFTL